MVSVAVIDVFRFSLFWSKININSQTLNDVEENVFRFLIRARERTESTRFVKCKPFFKLREKHTQNDGKKERSDLSKRRGRAHSKTYYFV